MTLDPFQTLVVLVLAVIRGAVVAFFGFCILDGMFGLGLLNKLSPDLKPAQPPDLKPAQPLEIETQADADSDVERLVEKIMALTPFERVLLAEIARRQAADAGIELPPFPQ